MHCVNITIWRCQLIGIDYGKEGRSLLSERSGPEGWSFYGFLSSHPMTKAGGWIITIFDGVRRNMRVAVFQQ